MRRRHPLLVAIPVALLACSGGGDPADGGPGDALPRDDGPLDGGADAGPPPAVLLWEVDVTPAVPHRLEGLAIRRILPRGPRVIIAGSHADSGGAHLEAWLGARHPIDGAPDPLFGIDGQRLRPDFEQGVDVLESGGQLLAFAGIDDPSTVGRMVIERLDRATGASLTSLGLAGLGQPFAIAGDGRGIGALYGADGVWSRWVVQLRDPTRWVITATITASTPAPPSRGRPPALELTAASAHVVWGEAPWIVERHARATGALETRFEGSGSVVAMIADDTGYWIASHRESGSDGAWRLERRTPVGSLDPRIGVVGSNPTALDDPLEGMVRVGGRLYLFGGAGGTNDGVARIEARRTSDGALDPTFASGGVWSAGSGRLTAVAGDATTLYAALTRTGTAGQTAWLLRLDPLAHAPAAADGGAIAPDAGSAPPDPQVVYDVEVTPQDQRREGEQIRALEVDGDTLLMAGSVSARGWIATRDPASGALRSAFARGGELFVPTVGEQGIRAVLTASAVAAFWGSPGGHKLQRFDRWSGTLTSSRTLVDLGYTADLCAGGDALLLSTGGVSTAVPQTLDAHSALDLARITTFGAGGRVDAPLTGLRCAVRGGAVFLLTYGWRMHRYALADGTHEHSFEGGGLDPALAVGDDAHFVAERVGQRWSLRKRGFDGAFPAAFGGVGASASLAMARVTAVAVEGARVYVLGDEQADGRGRWRLEARRTDDGALDPTFAQGGAWLGPRPGVARFAHALAVGDGGVFVAGRVVLRDQGGATDDELRLMRLVP